MIVTGKTSPIDLSKARNAIQWELKILLIGNETPSAADSARCVFLFKKPLAQPAGLG